MFHPVNSRQSAVLATAPRAAVAAFAATGLAYRHTPGNVAWEMINSTSVVRMVVRHAVGGLKWAHVLHLFCTHRKKRIFPRIQWFLSTGTVERMFAGI